MLVKDIIKKALIYLLKDNETIKKFENGEVSEELQEEIDLLLCCVNNTNKKIATQFLPLKARQVFYSRSGIVMLESFNHHFYDCLKVRSLSGESLVFEIFNDHIDTQPGEFEIVYAYLPEEKTFSDMVETYGGKIDESAFACGVVSEYLFLSNEFNEYAMWENKFNSHMEAVCRKKAEIKIPKRRWI